MIGELLLAKHCYSDDNPDEHPEARVFRRRVDQALRLFDMLWYTAEDADKRREQKRAFAFNAVALYYPSHAYHFIREHIAKECP